MVTASSSKRLVSPRIGERESRLSISGPPVVRAGRAHMRRRKRANARCRTRKGERAEVEDGRRAANQKYYTSASFCYFALYLTLANPASHGERDVIDQTFHRALRAVPAPSRAIAREFLECSSAPAETMYAETIGSREWVPRERECFRSCS